MGLDTKNDSVAILIRKGGERYVYESDVETSGKTIKELFDQTVAYANHKLFKV